MKRTAIIVAVCLGLLYLGDFLWVRLRVHYPAAGAAFGSVDVYYGTPLKNGKEEFFFGQSDKQTCVKSLFPQMGYSPCWYASKRTMKSVRLRRTPQHNTGPAMAGPPISFHSPSPA
jgi:hypothetical protein